MNDNKKTVKDMEERMKSLAPADRCALFLLASRNLEDAESDALAGVTAHGISFLKKFFNNTDVIGCVGKNRIAVLHTGELTGDMVVEKASVLAETLYLAHEDTVPDFFSGYVGIYLFQGGEGNLEQALKKAEYALDLAGKQEHLRYYICVSEEAEARGIKLPGSAYSSRLLHYIDEGIRLLDVGETIEVAYASPGFIHRYDSSEILVESWNSHIHPADRKNYEKTVRKAARLGDPEDGKCKVSRDGGGWFSCRFRLLRIPGGDGAPRVLEISHNVDGLEQLKYQYDEKQEWMRFLTEREDCQLWEADLKTRSFRMLYIRDLMEGREMEYENFPESMIENGRVHLNSAEEFRKFAEGIYAGKPNGHGNFIIQYRQSSCYGWASMSYHMLYDKEGQPEKAIGIKEDLSYLPSRQSKFIQRRIMPADLYPHLYGYFQANLSRDRVEKFQVEGREQLRLIRCLTYTEIVEEGIFQFFVEEDCNRIKQRFGRETLQQKFLEGRRWFLEQSRAVHFDGTICWISSGINLCADPETGDVCLFAYLLDQNQHKEWENELRQPVSRDLETGLMNEETFKNLSDKLMEKYEGNLCAVISIHIVGAEELFADEIQKQKENDILTALHVFLGADCLTAQTGRGRLTVFIPRALSQNSLKNKLENAFFFARISLNGLEDMLFLRFVAGVVFEKAGKSNYQKMEQEASRLCARHTAEASDTVIFAEELYGSGEDESMEQEAEDMEPYTLDAVRRMSESDKDAALECMSFMLQSKDSESSLNGVLEKLGIYYHADRVYILALTEGSRIVTMLNEWTAKGKYSIQQSLSGKRIEQFPAIARCANSKEPVVLSARKYAGRQDGWQYAVFPMGDSSDLEQLLCLENPRENLENASLLERMIPHLVRERKRFREAKADMSPMDRLFSLSNRQAFLDTVYSLNSDTCISMGVLAIDIPDYSAVKAQKGYEYGSCFLLKISEALIGVFGNMRLFHMQEAEFVVLCKNTTYKAFLDMCAHVRYLLNQEYAGQYRMGNIWSDGIFNARDLVEKAQTMMNCVTAVEKTTLAEISGNDWGALFQNKNPWMKLHDVGRFTIYLQPKVDMRSGKLIGAEALLRVLDESGNLLSHSRVIESMEREGTIQDVDYFVFDKMLYTMSQWKKKGYRLVPISSNFSRNTLLNPSSLASVLAIMSRYPNIPHDLVELEITETAGDYGNRTISELIRRFEEYGFRFSLDDLGSSYANLSMLADLHFHSIKLDRSLVRNISRNTVSRIMVRDIVKICKSRGTNCIAEGVETKEQEETLLEDGLKYAQGYLYGRPMSLQEFEKKYFQS